MPNGEFGLKHSWLEIRERVTSNKKYKNWVLPNELIKVTLTP